MLIYPLLVIGIPIYLPNDCSILRKPSESELSVSAMKCNA